MGYGGGREEYFAYLGDEFSDYPGSDSGMFPFALSDEEPLFGLGAVSSPNQAAISIDRGAAARGFLLVDAGHGEEQSRAAKDKSRRAITAISSGEQPPRTEPDEVRANIEAHAGGEGRREPPEWRWWNPFTWFNWGVELIGARRLTRRLRLFGN